MEKHEKIGTGDPYGAIAIWYFEANRDPEKFLKIFEGIAPEVEGMVWLGMVLMLAQSLRMWLERPRVVRGIDGVVGAVITAFGIRLALD